MAVNQTIAGVIEITPEPGVNGGGTITYTIGKGFAGASVFHFTAGTWQKLTDSSYNSETGIIKATTTSFSPFAFVVDAPANTEQPTTPGTTTPDSTSAIVTVTSPDGQAMTVTVTTGSVEAWTSARQNLAQGANQILADVIDITPPAGTTGGGKISYKVGTGYESASIYHYEGSWKLLSDSNYNKTTGIVTATTPSFSPFAIVKTEDPTATPTTPDNGPAVVTNRNGVLTGSSAYAGAATVATAEKALGVNPALQDLYVASIFNLDGLYPYTVKLPYPTNLGRIQSVQVFMLGTTGVWTEMKSSYAGGWVTTQIEGNAVLAVLTTIYPEVRVVLPKGTQYYEVEWLYDGALPSPKGNALTLSQATLVTMYQTYANGYTLFYMAGRYYVIAAENVPQTPAAPGASGSGSSAGGGAGTTTGTSPKTSDASEGYLWLIPVIAVAGIGAVVAFRKTSRA